MYEYIYIHIYIDLLRFMVEGLLFLAGCVALWRASQGKREEKVPVCLCVSVKER